MRTEEEIKHKIQELEFVRDKILGIADGDKIGIFIRALKYVLQENEDE